ncbi:hypothetical protein MMC29_000046 [Sticta canariensis]|nr:hypothetical protein [Sticta canariensis]
MHIFFSSILGFATLSLLTSVCAGPISIVQRSLGLPWKASETETITAINQKLSLYGLALDTKKFNLLKDVYTADCVVNLGLGPIYGLDKLLDYETKNQGKIPAHHFAANVYVSNITETSATVTSDAIATRFGQGPKYPGTDILVLKHDQLQAFYERFEDKFVKERDGQWRIKTRDLTIIALVGDADLKS